MHKSEGKKGQEENEINQKEERVREKNEINQIEERVKKKMK